MATVKKGTLTPSHEWAKHLRSWGKRLFWKSQRQAVPHEIATYDDDTPDEPVEPEEYVDTSEDWDIYLDYLAAQEKREADEAYDEYYDTYDDYGSDDAY